MSSSPPEICTGSEPSLLTAGISEELTQTRATSSITMHRGERVGAGTAVLLGHVRGVEVRGEQRLLGLGRVARLLVDRRGVRRDLGLRDGAHRLADGLVLVGEGVDGEIAHGADARRAAPTGARRASAARCVRWQGGGGSRGGATATDENAASVRAEWGVARALVESPVYQPSREAQRAQVLPLIRRPPARRRRRWPRRAAARTTSASARARPSLRGHHAPQVDSATSPSSREPHEGRRGRRTTLEDGVGDEPVGLRQLGEPVEDPGRGPRRPCSRSTRTTWRATPQPTCSTCGAPGAGVTRPVRARTVLLPVRYRIQL